MGIDRIGNPPPAPPASAETTPGERRSGVGAHFEVRPAAADGAREAQATHVEATGSALDRLRSGELNLDGYLDQKVDEATAHLAGLSGIDLDAVRSALRDRLSGDPMLAELVRTATGHQPEVPSDV